MLGAGASAIPPLCIPGICLVPCRTQILLRCLKPCLLAGQLCHQRCHWGHRNTCCINKLKTEVKQKGTFPQLFQAHDTDLPTYAWEGNISRLEAGLGLCSCFQVLADRAGPVSHRQHTWYPWYILGHPELSAQSPSGDRVLNKSFPPISMNQDPCPWHSVCCCGTSQHQE